jgi:CheY-like chemotaxis protein
MQRRDHRVLIVDENPSHRGRLRTALLPLDARLDAVDLGPGGFILAGRRHGMPPSLILVHVPDHSFNGTSTLAALRLLHPDIPMIVMANDPFVLQVAMTDDLRLPRYVRPDIQPGELLLLIQATLSERAEPQAALPDEAIHQGPPFEKQEGVSLPTLMRLQSLFPGYEVRIASEGA